MLKHHRLLLASAAAAAIAVTGVTAAAGSPPRAPPRAPRSRPGTEYVQIMSTSPTSGPASAIAHGVFTAAGEAQLGDARLGRIVFPGTIMLSHEARRAPRKSTPGPA